MNKPLLCCWRWPALRPLTTWPLRHLGNSTAATQDCPQQLSDFEAHVSMLLRGNIFKRMNSHSSIHVYMCEFTLSQLKQSEKELGWTILSLNILALKEWPVKYLWLNRTHYDLLQQYLVGWSIAPAHPYLQCFKIYNYLHTNKHHHAKLICT